MPVERLSITGAATLLNTTEDAVLQRISQGILASERDVDGHVWVLLDPTEYTERPDTEKLIRNLEAEVTFLREQLSQRDEEVRRRDHLLAAALERIPPPLEPPQEASESPSEATEEESRVQEEHPERGRGSSWWRRFFGY